MRESDLAVLRTILQTRGGFGHEQHIELAWNYLAQYPVEAAHEAVASAIRHMAGLHGAPDKYHDTITRTWIHLVAVHRSGSDAESFEEFIAHNRGLLDRHVLERHYSRELIASPEARARWTAPDLHELPVLH
jgi:hypothetical protein